jgi:putative ABC transport system substrate-binding protein
MRRRAAIAALVGAAVSPLTARAQQEAVPTRRIGVVLQGGPYHVFVEGMREALKAAGMEDGKQVRIVVREAKGDPVAAASAARELERDGVNMIVAVTTVVAQAVQRATTNVPVVFVVGSDPVASGLVDSIPRPGGRLTGVHFPSAELTAKRLGLLREIVPTLRRIVTYHNPEYPGTRSAMAEARSAARRLDIDLVDHEVGSLADIRAHLALLGAAQADAFFFVTDSLVNSHGTLIIDAAHALKMPTMAHFVDLVRKGALAAYGLNYRDVGLLAAKYVSRILSGTQPGHLPVEAMSQPVLAINLKTARALGLTMPPTLLARADEVVE